MTYGQIVDTFVAAGQDYVTIWDLERNIPLTGVVSTEIGHEPKIGNVVSFDSEKTNPDGLADDPIAELKVLNSDEVPDDLAGRFTDNDIVQVLMAYTRVQAERSATLAVRNVMGLPDVIDASEVSG